MSALRLTQAEWVALNADPTLDDAYKATRLGASVVEYLAWKRLGRTADRTLDQYERDLARLCCGRKGETLGVGHKAIDEVDGGDLMRELQSWPVGSWRRVRAAWGGFFDWAVLFDRRTDDPMRRLPQLRPQQTKVYEVFSDLERAKLVDAQDDSLLDKRDRLGAIIFGELGVRKSEARRMQPAHFDMAARVVFVLGKGNKERLVPFSDELWTALMDFMHEPIPRVRMRDRHGVYHVERCPTDTDYVFFPSGKMGAYRDRVAQVTWTDPTRPMSSTAMHGWWERCVKRADVRYRSMHMNRHTLATDLVDAEVDAFTVKDWLGHADTRTTEIYVHNSRERLRKAAAKLEASRRPEGAT